MEIVPQRIEIVRIADMVCAPLTDRTPCSNIVMIGNPVGLARAASISPTQNKTAIRMASPNAPFKMTVNTIARGTITAAFWISSDI